MKVLPPGVCERCGRQGQQLNTMHYCFLCAVKGTAFDEGMKYAALQQLEDAINACQRADYDDATIRRAVDYRLSESDATNGWSYSLTETNEFVR